MKKYLYLPCLAILALAACDDAGNGNQQQSEVISPPTAVEETIVEGGYVSPETAASAETAAGGVQSSDVVPQTGAAEGDTMGNSGPSEDMNVEDTPPAPNPETFNEGVAEESTELNMSCGDHTAWIGQPVDESAVKATGQIYRIVKPGMPMTMDYRAERINIEHDDANLVTRVWCG